MTTRTEAIAALTAPGQRYELQTLTVDGRACRVFVNAPPSLRSMYDTARSEAPFIVYEDERLSFAAAWDTAARIAALLVEEYGVGPGDRVAISMRNYPEWITTFVAATSIGAIAVAMNSLWSPEEMAFSLGDSGARVLIADQERVDRYETGANDGVSALVVRPTRPNRMARDLADALAGVGTPEMPVVGASDGPAPDDAATMFFTSGSTGHPKGVVSTHRNVIHALLSWELDARVAIHSGTPPGVNDYPPAALLGIPLFHVTGAHAVYLISYRAQRKLVSMYKWDPEIAAELIERERITAFVAPPALTGDLVRVARTTGADLSSLLTVGGGGASRTPEQVAKIGSTFGAALPNTGWGMTETNAIGAGIGNRDYLDHPASSGRASAVIDLRVVDDDGNELPAGERGELQVRGTSVFRGYWNRPDTNAEVFVDDDWFRTGDVAYLDADGYLYIVDRIKDLIIRGGENIGCGQVEAALELHPHVHEAAVYSVPDERLGEEVGATVYADPAVDADELRTFVRGHLASFEVPRYLRVESEPLPRIASGKIAKRMLRTEAVAALAEER